MMKKTIVGASQKGASYDNQDTQFTLQLDGIKVLGVFDGHGLYGKKAANDTKNKIKVFFEKATNIKEWSKEQHITKMTELFNTIHTEMKKEFEDKNYDTGGTTATIVVVIHNDDGSNDIITSNVGDSTAMVFGEDSKYEFLSENHNPDSKKEFDRIRDLDSKKYPSKLELVYETQRGDQKIFDNGGNKISKYIKNPWGNGLTPINVRYEPATRAVGGGEIRIAMTHSIGDFRGKKYGLSHTPTITFKKAPEDCIICVASDGLWDNWKYEDLSSYLTKLKDKPLESVLSETMTETMKRGTTNFGKKNVDDTTCVLCFL